MRRSNKRKNEISALAQSLHTRNETIVGLHKEITKLKAEREALQEKLFQSAIVKVPELQEAQS